MTGAFMMICSGVKAGNRAKYPEWKGAWERYVPPVSGFPFRSPPAWGSAVVRSDQVLGTRTQAALTPKYQKVLEDSIADP